MFQDPFADLIPGNQPAPAPAAAPRVVVPAVRQPPAQTPEQRAGDILRNTRTGQEIQDAPLSRANTEQQMGIRALDSVRIPREMQQDLDKAVSAFGALERAVSGFNDDFSGFGSGLESSAQGVYSGIGTPGQRAWWADFYSADNAARNALFGASLSAGEQGAYQRTTISPNMDPAEVRRNLEQRRALARAALARRVAVLRAGRYSEDQIRAALGEYGPLLEAEQRPADDTTPIERAVLTAMDQTGEIAVTGLPGGGGGAQPGDSPHVLDARSGLAVNNQGELGRVDIGFNDGPDRVEGRHLTPEEWAELQRFERTRPNAQQLREWWAQRGLNLTNADDIAAQIAAGQYSSNVNYEDVDAAARPDISDVRTPGDHEGLDAFLRGGADVVTLGHVDEIRAARDTLISGGTYAENLDRQRTIDEHDRQGWSRTGGQIFGGFGLPMGEARNLTNLGIRGAAYSGGYGFGSGTDARSRIQGALTGVAIGAPTTVALGAATNRVTDALAARAATRQAQNAEASALANAAQQENVRVSRPVVDPRARDTAARLDASRGGGGVREGFDQTRQDIGNAVERLGTTGTTRELEQVGAGARESFTRYRETSRNNVTAAYNRAAQLGGNPEFAANRAIQSLRDDIATLSRNGNQNSNEIKFLQTYLDDLVDATTGRAALKTVDDLADMRTNLRGLINQSNMMGTRAEARITRALNAADDDIADALSSRPGAMDALREARRLHAERAQTIREAQRLVFGREDMPAGDAKVFQNIQRLMSSRGDSARLERILATLSDDDRLDFAATVASNIGRAGPGEEFRLATFMRNTTGMSDSGIRAVFGADGLRSINNLRDLTTNLQAAQARLNNTGSGRVVNWQNQVRDAVLTALGVGGTAFASGAGGIGTTTAAVGGGLAIAGAGALRTRLSTRALMNSDVTQILRSLGNARSSDQARVLIERLSDVARRNPAIQEEVLPLRTLLLNAVNDNAAPMGRAAASDNRRNEN